MQDCIDEMLNPTLVIPTMGWIVFSKQNTLLSKQFIHVYIGGNIYNSGWFL